MKAASTAVATGLKVTGAPGLGQWQTTVATPAPG